MGEVRQENKMGVMSEGKLLMNMSLPMMISMLVQALYNIVDSIFVSQVSENALTAVSMAFPLQTLLIAVGAGTGVGVNSLLSKSLGEKKFDRANKTAMNGIFLYVISYVVSVVIGLVAVRPFYASQIKNAPAEIMDMGVQYLTIVMVFSFGLYAQFIFERILQATGRTFFSMVSQLAGAVINIILDPIFIFGFKMGITGAAIATVVGQIVGGAIAMLYNLKKNDDVHLSLRGFRPDAEIIGGIYKVGVPSIIMQSIGSVMTYGFNMILKDFSSTAVAVFGAYFKLQSFFFMPVFGLNNGIIPIVAYNYGARKKKRMITTIKWGYLVALGFMLAGFAVFMLIPDKMLYLFNPTKEMLAIGVPALRIISVSFLLAWFSIVTGSCFQALGNGMYSLYVSVARQLVALLPAAYILARIGGLSAIWWSFPIAEVVGCTISAVCLGLTFRKVVGLLPDEA